MDKLPVSEKPVPSPCISICVLNEDDICTGCYRSASEIIAWSQMSNKQKLATIQLALDRERQVNPFL